MKRQLILTLTLLLFMLLIGCVCEYSSSRIASSYQNDMLSVASCLSEENWEGALSRAESICADWKKESRVVQLWVNHADIDHVTEGLISLRSALIARDFPSALTAYSQCTENFAHLHHRDAFTLQNIL